MAMVASPSFLKDMQVNWGSIASVSEEASRAMETVQAKAKQPEDMISTAQLPVSSVRDAVILLQSPGSGAGREIEPDELREIVAELIAAYSDPDLQRKIRDIYEKQRRAQLQASAAGVASEDHMAELRELLWPCQTDIAEAYGLPGTTEGLQRIQNSVQRRITEGDIEVRCLADEALMLIGMSPLQNIIQEVKAEDFLNCIYGAAGDSSGTEIEEFFLNLRCETPLEKAARARGLMAARRLKEERNPPGGLTCGLLRTWAAYEKLGLAPQHIISTEPPPVARLKNPTAAQVWEFVLRNQPVIIEGACNPKDFPPATDFADFDYMRARCGHRYVKVKGDSCWDNKGRQLFLNDPTIEISVSDYLDLVEVAEEHETCISWYMGKLPLHTDLPELFEDINNSPNSPWRKFGTCFGENNKGVHTYFGCGGNTTCIHSDPSENLLMVVMGEKFMDIYPPCDAACMHTTVKKFLNSLVPPFIDPNHVPEEVDKNWGNYKYAQPQKVHLKAGDLFYLPIFWWHSVQGSIGRNMILNWWCLQHPYKEHRYTGYEGAREVLEVLQHLNEAWSSNDKSAASAQERSVAQELGNGVLYSDSMCAASNSYKKLVAPPVPKSVSQENRGINLNSMSLGPTKASSGSAPTNGFRWKSSR
ncbi:kdm8 [Symbiodinium necroappetens]|uniref:Kdm8 protein n=1 Tax=Symbiodinium necroappetens TaxID=1628268 RepID=A0A813A728_9DINO|nr:kdm8 [Symbiodinium necroappetens]|mmetsp:Transcript_32853/g.78636  ORF Transcript_32853/g.78636 Transcript_32853/m.78636 type:complete len:645 (-) Transcript_32853:115-2049(-)